ncbi:ABC transporter ATP-binding protein [Paenibacillus sp. UNC499MF]|uniref:ABC transporter ATP-binding protein n=1 Tax=Paenibacillus sp. UNC499MF TaxID=1502751 RepID=UPI0008A002B3|nr:ABC transporter ATP-binding protein [Paenibacillus sp. UNC499MF]SEG56225.1 peptide/nickel transport system ATP-binding protein [Paenibacillus sp. UNC499MF]
MNKPLLEIKQMSTHFYTDEGTVKAVDNVSLSLKEGETLCIVGESGCGKSVTAMSLMRLVQEPGGKTVAGEVWFDDKDLLKAGPKDIRHLRGNEIAMIFQEPMTSLNPVLTVGEQMIEPIIEHQLVSRKQAKKQALELITMVGIARAESIYDSYPHELSGGMLQRIMIAIALSCNPRLLVADEPTTALDVTIQAQILDLLRKIKEERRTSILLITHDLGVVAEMADHVVVMYAGQVIEESPVLDLFRNPRHPYTQGLLRAKPVVNQRKERLYTIPGQVPKLVDLQESCYFSDRCEHCMEICRTKQPPMLETGAGHRTACWLYEEGVR